MANGKEMCICNKILSTLLFPYFFLEFKIVNSESRRRKLETGKLDAFLSDFHTFLRESAEIILEWENQQEPHKSSLNFHLSLCKD